MKYYKKVKVYPGLGYTVEYFRSSFETALGLVGRLSRNGYKGSEYHFPASKSEWEMGHNTIKEVILV